MIIIEGMDGCGKSNLAHLIGLELSKRKINITHHKFKGIPKSKEVFEDRLKSTIPLLECPTILDRAPFISEYVYGPLTRSEGSYISYSEVRDIMVKYKPLLIYCLIPVNLNQTLHKIEQHEDPNLVNRFFNNQTAIMSRYAKVLRINPKNTIYYNWFTDSLNERYLEIINQVIQFIQSRGK